MRLSNTFRRIIAGTIAAAAMASGASAATLLASDLPGGSFSSSVSAPTEVAAGITSVRGSVDSRGLQTFAFIGLPDGEQDVTFTFAIDVELQSALNGWRHYNAGGNIRYSIGTPFAKNSYTGGSWFGTYSVDNRTLDGLTDSLTLTLPGSFTGPLYVALNTTHGSAELDFTIGVPSNLSIVTSGPTSGNAGLSAGQAPSVSAVPVPATGLLLAGAIGAFGLQARRRRRRA